MIVEYTKYKVDEKRVPAFLEAHRRAVQHLQQRGVRYELSRCATDGDLYLLRIEWPSNDYARFRAAPGTRAFHEGVREFERDIKERRAWEVTDVIYTARSEREPSTADFGLPAGRAEWPRLHAWIIEHLHERITVERMAEQVHMSPRNFARVFRRDVRMTPGVYLQQVRVAAAKVDLRERVKTLQQIAFSRGFGSTSTMRRSFLRVLGALPTAFYAKFAPQTTATHESAPVSPLTLAESARSLSLSTGRSDATMLAKVEPCRYN